MARLKFAIFLILLSTVCRVWAENPPASAFLPAGAASAELPPNPESSVSKPNGRRLYRISLIAVGAANAADTFSSWGQAEANPVLGRTFNGQSALIKAGLVGASFAVERLALRHNPSRYGKFAWLNLAIAGGLGAVAVHNVGNR